MQILVSDKVKFWPKKSLNVTNKSILNSVIHNEAITAVNIYAPDNTATIFIEQKLQEKQGDIGRHTSNRILLHIPFIKWGNGK